MLPFPTSLSTIMAPSCPFTIPITSAIPSPRPMNFVVKNGSRTRRSVSASIPQPVSETSRKTKGPGLGFLSSWLRFRQVSSQSITPVLTVIWPSSSPMASEALFRILIRSRRIWSGSPLMRGSDPSSARLRISRLAPTFCIMKMSSFNSTFISRIT